MTHRNFHGGTAERVTICSGSNRRPLSHWLKVGVCPGCGVRTFLAHGGLVRPHETTRADVADFRRRGPRQARSSG